MSEIGIGDYGIAADGEYDPAGEMHDSRSPEICVGELRSLNESMHSLVTELRYLYTEIEALRAQGNLNKQDQRKLKRLQNDAPSTLNVLEKKRKKFATRRQWYIDHDPSYAGFK